MAMHAATRAHSNVIDFDARVKDLRSRTAKEVAEDLEVQVRTVDGAWHQKAIGGKRSKCGEQDLTHVDNRYCPVRAESYLGRLCSDGCFSEYEITVLKPAAEEKAREEDETDQRR